MHLNQISLVRSWLSTTNAYSSNFIGYFAGYSATNANQSNFIGPQAGSSN
jgi:hypothetical protein